jgi:hypothetical protein
MEWSIGAALICLLIAFGISGIIMAVKRGSLKSVRSEHAACNYVRSGSFKLTNQNDVFLYDNVTRRPRPQKNNNNNTRDTRNTRR